MDGYNTYKSPLTDRYAGAEMSSTGHPNANTPPGEGFGSLSPNPKNNSDSIFPRSRSTR